MSDKEGEFNMIDQNDISPENSPPAKKQRKSATRAKAANGPTPGRGRTKNVKIAEDEDPDFDEDGSDFEAELNEDSDYNPGEDDPPSPKTRGGGRRRGRGVRASTGGGRGRGKGRAKKDKVQEDNLSDAGSTDVDEYEEDFEIQEGVDDAEDIFADDAPAPKDDGRIYEFETESNSATLPKRRFVPIRPGPTRPNTPAPRLASTTTASQTWGTNYYSAIATSLKTRGDLENYSNFLRSPYVNINLDKFLVDYCKPSAQHAALFFGPSASLQALMSRICNGDLIVDLLTHFMNLSTDNVAYKPTVFVPLIHQTILPIDAYEILNSKLNQLSKSLGYENIISPAYFLDSHNIYSKAKQNSSFSTHQLVSLYSHLPMAGYTDLLTNIFMPNATFKQFENYVSVPRDEITEYAENSEVERPESKCLGRITMLTDSNGKILGLAIMDVTDKSPNIPLNRQRMPFVFPAKTVSKKVSKSPRSKSVRDEVKECLNEVLDWVCATTGSSTKSSNKSSVESLNGVHVMDAILLTSNAKPHVLLAVGIRSTAEPPFHNDSEVPPIILCSLGSDENTFLTNQGVTPNLPMSTKGRFLLDSGAFFRERSSLLIPDALYSNIRRMAITEVISTSSAVAGLGVAAVPMNKEADLKWLMLDSTTHIPLCMAVNLPFSFSMQQVPQEISKIREPGRETVGELSNYSEDQLQFMETHFSDSSESEYRVAVINGLVCALKVDFDNNIILKVVELLPASYENIYPREDGPLIACQAVSADPKSISTCLRVYNKDTDQTSFLPAVFYGHSDVSGLSKLIAGYVDRLADIIHSIPFKISFYDIALRMALRDTPKILARQHRISAISAAEQHKLDNPDALPIEIPSVPERWNVCTLCLREFHSNIGLYHHELRHINIGRFQCQTHDQLFLSEDSYKRHLAKEHFSASQKLDEKPQVQEEEEIDWISDNVLKLFDRSHKIGEVKLLAPQCKLCADFFPTADVMTQHLDVCTGTSIIREAHDVAIKMEDSTDANETQQTVKTALLTCGICGSQHDDKSSLRHHFLDAHLTCVVCLQPQRSLEELSYHYGAHLAKTDPELLLPPTSNLVDNNDIGARLRSIQTCDDCTNFHGTGANFAYHQAVEHGITRLAQNFDDEKFVTPLQSAEEKQPKKRMKLMQCKFCELEVPVAGSAYVDHLSFVHNVEVDMFQICRICAEVFPSDSALSSHIAAEHPLSVYALAGIQSVYSCPKCIFFAFYRGMINHCREIHKEVHPEIFECTHCGIRFSDRYEFRRHCETHTDGYNFQCPDCNRSFRLRMSLMVHIKNHHSSSDEIGPKACEFCGLVYPSGRLLMQHIDRTHNKELKLECMECSRRFRLETDLRRHIKEMHSGAVKCEVCNKICANLRSYSLHRNKHIRMRIFQCTDCNATFKSKASMKRHIRVDHLNLGPERFECQICGKIVCQIGMHMLTHKGTRFVCEYCGKGFTKSAYYNEHVRIHKGELPYECYICHKRFNKKSNLNVHLKFHEKNRDSDGNYIELRSRGRYSIMFGDAALTPEQRQARQSALNFAIMPTEHVSCGPDEPGAFNVGGPAMAAAKACEEAVKNDIGNLGASALFSRANERASARFDEMMAQENLSNGNGTLMTPLKKIQNGSTGLSSPKRARFANDE